MRNTKKGFTLVELLVVIAILAILATVSVVGYTNYIKNANESLALQELTQVKSSILAEDIVNNNFAIGSDGMVNAEGVDAFETYLTGLANGLNGNLAYADGKVTYTLKKDTSVVYVLDLKTGDVGAGVACEHVDTDGDYLCDNNCGAVVEPTSETLTLAQAIALANVLEANASTTNSYKVTGTVVEVTNTTYGNMTITNGTDTFTIYGVYMGETRYDSLVTKPAKGDTVTIYGQILNYNGVTPEVKDGELTDYTIHTCDYSEATCGADSKCVVCGATGTDLATGNHTYGDDNICTVCGADKSVDGQIAISKTAAEMTIIAGGDTSSNGASVDGKSIALDNNITVVFAKANSATAPAYYDSAIRLYQNGGTLTVTAATNSQMKTIKITLDGSAAGDGPISVTGGTASELNNYVYTITVEEGKDTVVITTTGTDKNSRVYVASIEIIYE